MKVPDTIYLEPYLDNSDKLHPSWYRDDIIGSGIEYIRKKALLEWLKEKVEWYEGTELSEVYQKVIDKLNSM